MKDGLNTSIFRAKRATDYEAEALAALAELARHRVLVQNERTGVLQVSFPAKRCA